MLNTRITTRHVRLAVLSALSLYFEVLLIRWLPSTVQVVAYFTNIVLLSSFLGMGIGFLLARRKTDLILAFPAVLLTLVVVAGAFSSHPITVNVSVEHLLGSYAAQGTSHLIVVAILIALVTGVFVTMGHALGRAFQGLRPLEAYSINVCGSLFGIVLFWGLSALHTPPVVWFAVGLLGSAWVVLKGRIVRVVNLALCGLIVILSAKTAGMVLWSPYYKIDVQRETSRGAPLGYGILVNQTYHQDALDLNSPAPFVRRFKAIYAFPYQAIHPKRVLVIGAGSGNDVSVALERGAQSVDAVEIDPVLSDLGWWLNPQRPYRNPAVHVIVDDARAFLHHSHQPYDLIAFGYLDAHRLLSSFSTVRMDNFIYTRESFEEAKRHLSSHGILAVTFLVFRDWIAGRLEGELRSVFGRDLITYTTGMYAPGDTVIFLAGPGVRTMSQPRSKEIVPTTRYEQLSPIRPATDDWPYLYLREASIPFHYLILLAGLLALALLLITSTGIRVRHAARQYGVFLLLGAAFMLMETKSITRFALLYGSTWVTNLAVISVILCLILLANVVAPSMSRSRLKVWYGALCASILLEWRISPSAYLAFGRVIRMLVSSVVLSLPIFCAGVIFACLYQDAADPATALGVNLAGAMVGGIIEYASMVWGFRALSVAAFLLYASSAALVRQGSLHHG